MEVNLTSMEVKQLPRENKNISVEVKKIFRGSIFYFNESKTTFVKVNFTSMKTFLLPWKLSWKETQKSNIVVDRAGPAGPARPSPGTGPSASADDKP